MNCFKKRELSYGHELQNSVLHNCKFSTMPAKAAIHERQRLSIHGKIALLTYERFAFKSLFGENDYDENYH